MLEGFVQSKTIMTAVSCSSVQLEAAAEGEQTLKDCGGRAS